MKSFAELEKEYQGLSNRQKELEGILIVGKDKRLKELYKDIVTYPCRNFNRKYDKTNFNLYDEAVSSFNKAAAIELNTFFKNVIVATEKSLNKVFKAGKYSGRGWNFNAEDFNHKESPFDRSEYKFYFEFGRRSNFNVTIEFKKTYDGLPTVVSVEFEYGYTTITKVSGDFVNAEQVFFTGLNKAVKLLAVTIGEENE